MDMKNHEGYHNPTEAEQSGDLPGRNGERGIVTLKYSAI